MKILLRIVSVLGVLLGGLWLVQGLGLVQVRPILCFADCEPVHAPSAVWVVLGLLLMAAGVFGIRRTARW